MLELLLQGLVQWLYNLSLEIVEYMANSLLDVFNMDLGYFESVAPVSGDILNILMAVGWALLLGNLVFQASKSMVSGIGVEGEDPALLFLRTFLFGFLLLASRQICGIGLGITSSIITMLQVPDAVTFHLPEETAFPIAASWLLVVIVGVVIMWQVLKLFLEIGERYVVMAVLTLSAPLAFATGGSKSTADIFKGWARMFGSMCVIMVFNVIFLKLLLSAMSYMPVGLDAFPWMLVIIGIARVARKIDGIITRVGLNPAVTGDGLGKSLPGMFTYAVLRSIGSTVGKTIGSQGGHRPSAGTGPKSGGPNGPRSGFGGGRTGGGFGGRRDGGVGGARAGAPSGAAQAASPSQAGTAAAPPPTGASGAPGTNGASTHQDRQDAASTSAAAAERPGTADGKSGHQGDGTRRTSATGVHRPGYVRPGTAGPAAQGSRTGSAGRVKTNGTAGTGGVVSRTGKPGMAGAPGRAGTATPPTASGVPGKPETSGAAGTPSGLPRGLGASRPDRPASQRAQASGPAADQPAKNAEPGNQAAARFSAVPPSSAPAPGTGGVRQGGAPSHEERRTQVPGGKPPRPGQASKAAPPGMAGTQTRASERTSAQSSFTQTSTAQSAQSGAAPAASRMTQAAGTVSMQAASSPGVGREPPAPARTVPPAGPASPVRREHPPSTGAPAGQHGEWPRPARQESPPPTSPQAGRSAQRPRSGTAGTAPDLRAGQGSPQDKPPRPSGQGVSHIQDKRPVPGGKPITAPKAQSQRRTKGGTEHGG